MNVKPVSILLVLLLVTGKRAGMLSETAHPALNMKLAQADSEELFSLGFSQQLSWLSEYDVGLIPGFGAVLVERVAQHKGGFQRREDLLEVHGIGERRLLLLLKYFQELEILVPAHKKLTTVQGVKNESASRALTPPQTGQ